MTSSVASRPGFLRWLVTAGDPATLVATFSTAAGSPVDLSGSTVAAACANWSTSHAGSATVGGASNNEVTVAFTDTITGQLTGGGWTWTLTVDGVTTLAGPLDVAQPGVAGVTGGDASAVVVVDDVNVAVTVVGGGGGGAVDSVNGQTGVVVLAAADVGADPAGTAAGLVDDLSGVSNAATARSNLGLGNVDNTSDANKPVSTAQQTALDGKAAASHSHSGADITSGTVSTARLGTGTASASTYLRGDQTWAAVTPGASAINDLTDVDTATDPPATDDVLAWDGVTWTPATLTALGAPGLSNATPADLGTAAPGVSTEASRADHVHDLPTAADVGAAASLHVHSGADITSGTVATARLGSGTANATTFLRGDQTWAVPSGGGDTVLTLTPATGDYIGPQHPVQTYTAGQLGLGNPNLVAMVPVYVPSGTYDWLGVGVVAGGSGSFRIGMYPASASGFPEGPPIDAGTITVASGGLVGITISEALDGWYWLAMKSLDWSSTATFKGTSAGSVSPYIPGMPVQFGTYSSWGPYLGLRGGSAGTPLSATPTWDDWANITPLILLRAA